MTSHISTALTGPVGVHVGGPYPSLSIVTAPHLPHSPTGALPTTATLHLPGMIRPEHHHEAVLAYHHHQQQQQAALEGRELKGSSPNSIYANRSSFMIDDILSKSRKDSESSDKHHHHARNEGHYRDSRIPEHEDPRDYHRDREMERYPTERRDPRDLRDPRDSAIHRDIIHQRERHGIISAPVGQEKYDLPLPGRRRSVSPNSSLSSSGGLPVGSRPTVLRTGSSESPSSTLGRPSSPSVPRRSRSPVSPYHISSRHGLPQPTAGHSSYHREDAGHLSSHHDDRHRHHSAEEIRLQSGEHRSPDADRGRHQQHTVHHHHQPLLQIDTRVPGHHALLPREHRRERDSPERSPTSLHQPARPTPIHPGSLHTHSHSHSHGAGGSPSSLPAAPAVSSLYSSSLPGSLAARPPAAPGAPGSNPAAVLPAHAPVGLQPSSPPVLPLMYDPIAAATLSSPYLQAPLGAYPGPAVYTLPPYTRPEYALFARHHPGKYAIIISLDLFL